MMAELYTETMRVLCEGRVHEKGKDLDTIIYIIEREISRLI